VGGDVLEEAGVQLELLLAGGVEDALEEDLRLEAVGRGEFGAALVVGEVKQGDVLGASRAGAVCTNRTYILFFLG